MVRLSTVSDVELVVSFLPFPPTDELTFTVTVYPRTGRSLEGGLHCTDREDRPPITVGVTMKEACGTEAGTEVGGDQKFQPRSLPKTAHILSACIFMHHLHLMHYKKVSTCAK